MDSNDPLKNSPILLQTFGQGWTLGGPTLAQTSQRTWAAYIVEIASHIDPGTTSYTCRDYRLVQIVTSVVFEYFFSDGSSHKVTTGAFLDNPTAEGENYPTDLFMVDGPGPYFTPSSPTPLFDYFKPNPPQAPGQPANTTVVKITMLMNFETYTVFNANNAKCATLKWHAFFEITGSALSNVAATVASP